jgi:hypothetical protein
VHLGRHFDIAAFAAVALFFVQWSSIMSNDLRHEPQQLSIARRRFMQTAMAGAGLLGLSRLGIAAPTPPPSIPPTQGVRSTKSNARDQDILNFALNLEYLEAEFYSIAATGQRLKVYDDVGSDLPGLGTVTGGRKVTFTTPIVRDLANELYQDELAHVRFLRKATTKSIPRASIDLEGSFTAAARAAGLVGPNDTFDPYANENNFLLASFIFEDVGVTAYKGAAKLIFNGDILEAAAGLLSVEAYHAGAIRVLLAERGLGPQSNAISTVRDSVDGSTDDDQGVLNTDGTFNIVPTDANGLTFSRTPGQVLSTVYFSPTAEKGGFFPDGVLGRIQ